MRNLDSEQLFELRENLSIIAGNSANITAPLAVPLSKLQFCKTPAELKKITKAATVKEHYKLVTVGLTSPKKISQSYMGNIAGLIDTELNKAATIEADVLEKRKVAATKIYTFWQVKRVEMREKREILAAIKESEAIAAEELRLKEQNENNQNGEEEDEADKIAS